MKRLVLLAAAAMALGGAGASAQEKLKIGVIATLSRAAGRARSATPQRVQPRVKSLDGKLGGRDVEVLVQTTSSSPISR